MVTWPFPSTLAFPQYHVKSPKYIYQKNLLNIYQNNFCKYREKPSKYLLFLL